MHRKMAGVIIHQPYRVASLRGGRTTQTHATIFPSVGRFRTPQKYQQMIWGTAIGYDRREINVAYRTSIVRASGNRMPEKKHRKEQTDLDPK